MVAEGGMFQYELCPHHGVSRLDEPGPARCAGPYEMNCASPVNDARAGP
jgi:hypothetical protein